MKLLVNQSNWQQWVKAEVGRFSDVQHLAPVRYPCYGYMVLESWSQETLKPMYLYQKDIDAMSLELMVMAQNM